MKYFILKKRLIFDSLGIFCAWFIAYYVRFYIFHGVVQDSLKTFFYLSFVAYFVTMTILLANKLYSTRFTDDWIDIIQGLFKTSLESFCAISTLIYFVFETKVSRITLLIFLPLLFIFLCLSRNTVRTMTAIKIKNGLFQRRTLLVGYGDKLVELANELPKAEVHNLGNTVIGQYLGKEPIEGVAQLAGNSISEIINKYEIDTVFISFPCTEKDLQKEAYTEAIEILNARVMILPDIPKSYAGFKVFNVGNIPVAKINSSDISHRSVIVKRVFDLVSCSLAVIILSPLFLLLSLLVKITSKGPVLFKQQRVTKDGKIFNMLKFRTMRIDMPEQNGPHFTEENDPRITFIGKFLRKTSLDELPQFFNVLQGSMSLIGPRPERPELVEQFKKEIPGYDIRHKMKAGLTGVRAQRQQPIKAHLN